MQRDMIHRNARRTQFVHFDGPQSIIYLPEDYPSLPKTQACFVGCQMPNPDIGPLIKQWRPRHMADHTPQTMLHLRDSIWAQRNPSPKGGDVLLLAAGPSLAENLINVRRCQEHATVVALNRAVMAYANPDIFFCLERQSKEEWWTKGYWSEVDPRTAVVTSPSCHAAICDHFPKESRWYSVTPWCGFDKWEDADEWALNLPALPTCETTMSAALAFCALLEPKRIILCGADHAFKVAADEQGNMAEVRDYYCDGEKWPGPGVNVAGVEGINGRLCAISMFSQKHAEVTEACCRQIEVSRNIEVINASGHGIVRHNVVNDWFWKEIQGRKEKAEKDKNEALARRFTDERHAGGSVGSRGGDSSAATHEAEAEASQEERQAADGGPAGARQAPGRDGVEGSGGACGESTGFVSNDGQLDCDPAGVGGRLR